MDKNIKLQKEARDKIIAGVNKHADTVKVTMGGQGKLVIIQDQQNIAPFVTKDGVTVSNFVDLQDPYEMQGSMLMKQVARETVDYVNDNTTTATVLAQALINEGVASGKTYRQLQQEFDEGLEVTRKTLIKKSKKANLFHVAKIAANGDEQVAKDVITAFEKTTTVLSELTSNKETVIHHEPGYTINSGFVHEAFKNLTLGKSLFIIYNDSLNDLENLLPAFEYAKVNGMSVLIATETYEDAGLNQLVYNYIKGFANLAVISIPYNKESWFIEMEEVTGAKPITQYTNDIMSSVGLVEKAVIGPDKTKIVTENMQGPDGICTIKVGGGSDAERREKLDRIDDAIGAVSSSFKYGVIPGGGNAIASVEQVSPEFKKALQYPRQVILENAEIDDSSIKHEYNKGYDVVTGEYKQNLIKAGIVDSTEGILKAIESAVSVAKIVLQTQGVILTIN